MEIFRLQEFPLMLNRRKDKKFRESISPCSSLVFLFYVKFFFFFWEFSDENSCYIYFVKNKTSRWNNRKISFKRDSRA